MRNSNLPENMEKLPVIFPPILFPDKTLASLNLNLTALAAALTGKIASTRVEMVLHTGYLQFKESLLSSPVQPETSLIPALLTITQNGFLHIYGTQVFDPPIHAKDLSKPSKCSVYLLEVLDHAATRGRHHAPLSKIDILEAQSYQSQLLNSKNDSIHFDYFCHTIAHFLCQDPTLSLNSLAIISNQIDAKFS